MLSLILATGNAHKAEEFARMFDAAGLKVAVHSAKLVGGMPAVEEDSGTFAGNALLKARALRALAPAEHRVLSDDSGLECDALGGMPGVDTAVYAGPKATAEQNRAKLLAALAGTPPEKRTARFVCHLVLLGPDGKTAEFTGYCPGRIAEAESGAGGFGYDPLFIPEGFDRTFAEIDAAEKDALSHRGRAFAKLAEHLRRLG